jgi:hypothetical protein
VLHTAGQRAYEGAERLGEQVRGGYEAARGELGRGYRQAERMIASHPTSSVLMGLGIGFGLGLVLTALLAERQRETWAARHLPDRLRALPDSLQDAVESLADTVRRLPDAIRDHLPAAISRH